MTNNRNYVPIDTTSQKAISPPGLTSPKDSISCHHPKVQEILAETFLGMFPSIVQSDEGEAYQLVDDRGFDRCSKTRPATHLGDIPKAELLKLLEGWIRLRRRLQDDEMSKKVRSILLNLKVPNPLKAIHQYRIEGSEEYKKLIVFWGYETAVEPCVPIEKALSVFLDVPVGHLQSILSTSMSPANGVTASVKVDTAMIQSLRSGEEAKTTQTVVVREQKSHKLMIPLAITCGILLTVVGFLGAHFFGKESPPPVAVVPPPPPAIMVPDRGKEPPVMNRKEPSPELPVEENVVSSEGPEVSDLDPTPVSQAQNSKAVAEEVVPKPLRKEAIEPKPKPETIIVEAPVKEEDLLQGMIGKSTSKPQGEDLLSSMVGDQQENKKQDNSMLEAMLAPKAPDNKKSQGGAGVNLKSMLGTGDKPGDDLLESMKK